jgi:hypothetical protein
LHGIPLLATKIEREVADGFDLAGSVTIEVQTASFRAVRGYAVAVALLDEVAFFPTDDGANPDTEIIAALQPAMATIPGAMMLCASSPYARRGALWDAFRRHHGNNCDPVLTWRAPTRVMNPSVPQSVIDAACERDPNNAAAEWLAEFRSDISSYIDRATIEPLVVRGVRERPPMKEYRYVAHADPSGGSGQDSFALCIAHAEDERVVIDAIRETRPPLSPEAVVSDYAALLKRYHLDEVRLDRYAAQWPVEAFRRHGVTVKHSDLNTSALFAEFLPTLNSGQVVLLDHDRAISQLSNLERRVGPSGRDIIAHPPSGHDDVAVCVAGAAYLAGTAAAQRGDFNVGFIGADGVITWADRRQGRVSALSGANGQNECIPTRF